MKVFTVEKLNKLQYDVRAAIYRQIHSIADFNFFQVECSRAERPDFGDRHWTNFNIGNSWGGYDMIAWFRTRESVPGQWHAQKLACIS